ncbi:MAG: hypothetical protein ACREO5_03595, partial [Candidatus Binatia bacterium]
PLPLSELLPADVPLLLPLAVLPSGQSALAPLLLLSGLLRPMEPPVPDLDEDPELPLEPLWAPLEPDEPPLV